jgi:hypothetical protein
VDVPSKSTVHSPAALNYAAPFARRLPVRACRACVLRSMWQKRILAPSKIGGGGGGGGRGGRGVIGVVCLWGVVCMCLHCCRGFSFPRLDALDTRSRCVRAHDAEAISFLSALENRLGGAKYLK